jgi:hypothetical protein
MKRMEFDQWPESMRLEEAAELLNVSPVDVQEACVSKQLPAVLIGKDWRIIKSKLLSQNHPSVGMLPDPTSSGGSGSPRIGEFRDGAKFRYQWPDGTKEDYDHVRETEASFRGRRLHVKIGFTTRAFADKPNREKATVFIDDVAAVEYGGANDSESSSVFAAVIKAEGGSQRHLRSGDSIPESYSHFRVMPYNQIVQGKHASSGLAVVCYRDDLTTMAEHALLRWDAKERARQN